MSTRIQQQTAAKWTIGNPILAAGTPGIETDTNQFKIGNGTTAWNSLAYVATSGPRSLWRSGNGVPANTLGADGDYYTDTATGTVYLRSVGAYAVTADYVESDGDVASFSSVTITGTDNSAVTLTCVAGKLVSTGVTAILLLLMALGPVQAQSVTNGTVSSITRTGATVSACLVNASTNSTLTLYWGTNNGYASPAAWSNSAVIASDTNNVCVSTNLYGLTGRTVYYFRGSLSNDVDGVIWPVNSGSFTTLAITNGPFTMTGSSLITNILLKNIDGARTNTLTFSNGFFIGISTQ